MSADSNLVSYRVPESVIADRYLLTVDVTSYTPEMDAETGDNRRKFCCASDKEVEKTLIDNFSKLYYGDKSISKYPHEEFVTLDYRKEVCKSIKITSDETLFGGDPGADLSSHFEFFDWWWFDTPSNFIIDSEKNLIGRLSRHLTIEEYLSYNPLMFPNATLRLKDIPQEAPVTVSFSVEIELEKDKVLSSTAPAITLTLE